jgi:FAD/FMN-containing dehydrogenase
MQDLLVRIVGAKNVYEGPSVLAQFSQDKSFEKPIMPQSIVKPHSVEEVVSVVQWANRTKTPLIPISSKAPHYKGDTVPGVPNAVIVDLSEMKRILSINRTHRIAIVEPGVTYAELIEALKKENLSISMPLAPRSGKSVMGSILETEPRLNALHQWCNLDPLRCAEVTWGDGNRMFTGEAGASALNLEGQWKENKWQWEPAGPMMLDFYRLLTGAQGTMGIVTWASVRCENMPQAHKGYLVPANKLEDLIDFSYRVLRLRFSDEFFIMNNTQLAYLMSENQRDVALLKSKLPPWSAFVSIAGREFLPEEKVAYQEEDIQDIAGQYSLQMLPSVGGVSGEAVLDKATKPCGEKYWKETYKGAFTDLFFSTTLDQTPGFMQKMNELASAEGYSVSDIGLYLQPENMGTSYHCSFTLPYCADRPDSAAQAKRLFEKASGEFAKMGAYYFRPYGIWSKLQLSKDPQSYKVQQRLKEIFDPNGILNPGKLCNY